MRFALAALALLATPVTARDLPVPPDKGWQHALTRLILPPRLDGLPRTRLIDQTDSEHDVAAEFADADTVATVYVFHPAIRDVAMWFERSEAQIFNRDLYGHVAPNSADPVPFAPPGSGTASALRRIYSAAKGRFRTTGLAVMPLGDWLVAIRISGTEGSSSALDAKLSAVIAAIRWPAGVATAPAPTPIPACPAPLAFGKAKQQRAEGTDILLTLLARTIASDPKAKVTTRTVRWCRDPASTQRYGVYRDGEGGKGYTLALGDAGRVVNVYPTLDAQTGKGDGYSVSLTDVDESAASFPGFDHLPAPQQVVAALGGPRNGTSKGNSITLDPNSLGK